MSCKARYRTGAALMFFVVAVICLAGLYALVGPEYFLQALVDLVLGLCAVAAVTALLLGGVILLFRAGECEDDG